MIFLITVSMRHTLLLKTLNMSIQI